MFIHQKEVWTNYWWVLLDGLSVVYPIGEPKLAFQRHQLYLAFSKQWCDHSPNWVSLKVFSFYMSLVNQNLGFENTNACRPWNELSKTYIPWKEELSGPNGVHLTVFPFRCRPTLSCPARFTQVGNSNFKPIKIYCYVTSVRESKYQSNFVTGATCLHV